jgi:hypothetical protein
MKKVISRTAILAATFCGGFYTARILPPRTYTFESRSIFNHSPPPLDQNGKIWSLECATEGTASAYFKSIYNENTKSYVHEGAGVEASWHPALEHGYERNVMFSADRKTLYWNYGYASLWGETLERKEGMSPYHWMDVINETDKFIVAVRAYPGGQFIPQISSLIIEKETMHATYTTNSTGVATSDSGTFNEIWGCS